MLGIIIFITFSLGLLAANIICFIKKKYLYLFIPCMLFLPEYYGIDFNNSFPIFTVTRMMFIVFFIYAFINRKRTIQFRKIDIKSIPKEYLLISGYFLFRIAANLYYVGTYAAAVKTIFLIIFEQLLFLVAFYMLSPTNEEIDKLFLVLVRVATVFFIIGIFESATFVRPFDEFYTVSRKVINEHYIRLGLLRSTTTFGMPGLYSNMCILMLPIIIHIYHLYPKKRYLVSVWLCILAIIHSGSRADYFYLPVIFFVYVIFFIKDKKRLLPFLKHAAIILASLFLFIGISCGGDPRFRYFYVGTGKSILNEVGFDFDLSEGAPEGVKGYGGNDKAAGPDQGGVGSRKVQLSGVIYTLETSPIFGLGSGALERKEVKYRISDNWVVRPAIDVGIVEVVAYEGLLGLIGMSLLLIALFMMARKNSTYLMLSIIYLLTTLNTVNMYSFLLLFIAIFMTDYKERTSLA